MIPQRAASNWVVLVWAMTARERRLRVNVLVALIYTPVYIHPVAVPRDVYRSEWGRVDRCRLPAHCVAHERTCTTSGRVCVARAPHGNDESSTLEHLVCSFLSAFHRSRSLADCCAPSLSPAFALAPVTMCTRATQRPVGRGRVMISRLFTRSRRCLPPAFHWPSSLSSHWLCLPRGSRHSFQRGRERERSSLSLHSHLRSGVGKFAWPRGYVFVSNDLCRQMGRARVKVSCTALSMTGIDGERSSTCFSKECGFVPARYPIPRDTAARPYRPTPSPPHPVKSFNAPPRGKSSGDSASPFRGPDHADREFR